MSRDGYDWIWPEIAKTYTNSAATKKDALAAIKQYRGLVPKIEKFVFNDGIQRDLLNLEGTIPISYKGTVYHIPICIWLLDTHPLNAPMCYVKPTPDMQIKVMKHVDGNGKVYLPYLHDWKSNKSDLLGVIQVMIIVFGEQPPVYKKTSRPGAQPEPQQHTYPPQPNQMPYPPRPGFGMPMPPGPPGQGFPPQSSYYGGGGYPAYPPPQGVFTGQGMAQQPGYPPAPQPSVASAQFPGSSPSSGTITEDHIRASLLSAVEDKIKRRLKDVYAQNQDEMEVLKRTHEDLFRGKGKLEDILNRLENEQTDLEKSIMILREKNEAMSDVINKLQSRDTVDIDDAVVTTAPVYKQLLDAYAEENATQDAIYYLGEALRKGVIDLDAFLKHVRELSRKQFMLRALMVKCREKAGLPS